LLKISMQKWTFYLFVGFCINSLIFLSQLSMHPNAGYRPVRWRSSSASDISTSTFSLAPQGNRVTSVTLVNTIMDSNVNCRQPASLPCRRNTRINDRHLNNVPGAEIDPPITIARIFSMQKIFRRSDKTFSSGNHVG